MGYFFALLAPFLDSVTIYLDKLILSKYKINHTTLTLFTGYFALVSGIVVFFLGGFELLDLKSSLIITLSGFLGTMVILTYFKALTLDEASRVGTLFQIVPVFVIILSLIFLQEKLFLRQYLGALFIVCAGIMLSINRSEFNKIKMNKAFWYMCLSCLFSALVYILYKIGVGEKAFLSTLPYEGLGNGIASTFILMYRDNYKLLIKSTRQLSKITISIIVINEFLYRLSKYAFFFALYLIPASIVSIIQGLQPFFLLMLGVSLSLFFPSALKEVVNKKTIGIKFAAAFSIFVGLYLLFI